MAAQIVIIAVLLVVAGAAVPVWRRGGDANALARGGAVLGAGIGAVTFGLSVYAGVRDIMAAEDSMLFATAPLLLIAGGLLAEWAARKPRGKPRNALLLAAAALSIGGAAAGAAFVIAGAAGLLAAGCYLAALGDPRALLRRLDPRD